MAGSTLSSTFGAMFFAFHVEIRTQGPRLQQLGWYVFRGLRVSRPARDPCVLPEARTHKVSRMNTGPGMPFLKEPMMCDRIHSFMVILLISVNFN